jgi:hypothetical protein
MTKKATKTNPTAITAADILRGGKDAYRSFEIPQLEGRVYHRPLPMRVAMELAEKARRAQAGDAEENTKAAEGTMQIIVDHLVDPDTGDKLFTDVEELKDAPIDVVLAIGNALVSAGAVEGNARG